MNEIANLRVLNVSEQAIEVIHKATAEDIIILDFDETLFLRDSTAEYLNALRPQILSTVYLRLAKSLRPWRWLSTRSSETDRSSSDRSEEDRSEEDSTKDWFLVISTTLLFPWTVLIWQYKARQLAKTAWNQPLISAIAHNPNAQIIIASSGFRWIINPLLKHLPASIAKTKPSIIACGFWQGAKDSAKGKLASVTEVLGASAIAQATIITDADQNWSRLAPAKPPYRLAGSGTKAITALSHIYVPLFYTQKIKHPNKSHIIKRLIVGQWSVLIIAFSFLSPHPLLNMTGLLMLNLSHWSIYEIGYWENDVIGEKYETKPKLSENYARYKDRLKLHTAVPWYWAIGIAVPALILLEASSQPGAASETLIETLAMALQSWPALLWHGGLWLCYLVTVRTTFWIYNRFDVRSRIWIYPVLQIQRLFGFTLILPINIVGAILLLSLAISRWLSYTIYRCGGNRSLIPLNLSYLWVFTMSFLALAIGSPNPAMLLTWQTAIAFIYCIVKALWDISRNGMSLGLAEQRRKNKDVRTKT